jgi:hypothetical protein
MAMPNNYRVIRRVRKQEFSAADERGYSERIEPALGLRRDRMVVPHAPGICVRLRLNILACLAVTPNSK